MKKLRIEDTVIISDLDGTLLPHGGRICDRDVAAARWYKDNGGLLTVATGRMPDSMAAAAPLEVNLPCIVSNGAVIYDFAQKKVLFERFLDPAIKTALPEAMEAFPTLAVQMRVLFDLFIARPNEQCLWHLGWENQKYTLVDYRDEIRDCHKMLLQDRHEVLLEVRAFLEERYPNRFEFVFSNEVFLEVLPKNCTKGDTVPLLLELAGYSHRSVLALGDQGNDLSMLAAAAVSCCPAGATDEVKRTADITRCAAGEGTLWEFIEYLKENVFEL